MLVLSVFPGVDLLGRGFEAEGFCVVRSPDLIYGGDVRGFHVPCGRFDGFIAGSPCQDFSRLRRAPPTGAGIAMIREYGRLILEGCPDWWLLENVVGVPDLEVEGYRTQRFDLNARECGALQSRLRHFQFGSKLGFVLMPERQQPRGRAEAICLASKAPRTNRRGFADFCELQGLPRTFRLDALTLSAKYRAVGNGCHVAVARTVARAIRASMYGLTMFSNTKLCACECGRPVKGRQKAATPGCRKRLERRRSAAAGVTIRGVVKVFASPLPGDSPELRGAIPVMAPSLITSRHF